MSLDDIAVKVWELERPPLGMLVAAKATEMLASQQREEVGALFFALSKATLAWWPDRRPQPEDIQANEYLACLEAVGDDEVSAKLRPLATAATLQMAGMLHVAPMSLPAGAYYDVDEADFQELCRATAKAGRLPVAQLAARLEFLLENYRDPWHKLITRVDRMSWSRGAAWTKLDKRLKPLASLADLGGDISWMDVSGQKALRVELEGTKRIAMLSAEELERLHKVVPAIGEPTA